MNLPKPEDLNAYVERLFGEDYTNTLRSLAKPVDPRRLRDCTPLPWDTTPFPADVEL